MDFEQDDALANALGAIASPTRLAILRALRQPRPLGKIVVRAGPSQDAPRPLARQTIRRHLDVLLQEGLVSALHPAREASDAAEFVTNHPRVFLLSEELRALARMRSAVPPEGPTIEGKSAAPPAVRGPQLVLVKGADEGAIFPLAGPRASWIIGRRRGVDVCLEYDPTASGQNAIIERAGEGYVLLDVRGSRNGTRHNFRLLAPDERVPLRHGDLVGVGRSLLLYWS